MGLNIILASCPWGLVTANGVDLLTEIYVIMPIGTNTVGKFQNIEYRRGAIKFPVFSFLHFLKMWFNFGNITGWKLSFFLDPFIQHNITKLTYPKSSFLAAPKIFSLPKHKRQCLDNISCPLGTCCSKTSGEGVGVSAWTEGELHG